MLHTCLLPIVKNDVDSRMTNPVAIDGGFILRVECTFKLDSERNTARRAAG